MKYKKGFKLWIGEWVVVIFVFVILLIYLIFIYFIVYFLCEISKFFRGI